MHVRPLRPARTIRRALAGAALVGCLIAGGVHAAPAVAATATYCGKTLDGPILDKYRAVAPAGKQPSDGRLGCPLTGVETLPGTASPATRVRFAGGQIVYSAGTGAHTLWGLIGAEWTTKGEGTSTSFYRLPTSDETRSSDGQSVYQSFERGYVSYGFNTGLTCGIQTLGIKREQNTALAYAYKLADTSCNHHWSYLLSRLVQRRYAPPRNVRVVFCDGCTQIAVTKDTTVIVNPSWVQQAGIVNSDGMMVHELTHAVSLYPTPTWVNESVADWSRYVSPEYAGIPWQTCNALRYDVDAYSCGSTFLRYMDGRYANFTPELNARMHTATDPSAVDAFFRERTGQSAETWWARCRASGQPCAGGRA